MADTISLNQGGRLGQRSLDEGGEVYVEEESNAEVTPPPEEGAGPSQEVLPPPPVRPPSPPAAEIPPAAENLKVQVQAVPQACVIQNQLVAPQAVVANQVSSANWQCYSAPVSQSEPTATSTSASYTSGNQWGINELERYGAPTDARDNLLQAMPRGRIYAPTPAESPPPTPWTAVPPRTSDF